MRDSMRHDEESLFQQDDTQRGLIAKRLNAPIISDDDDNQGPFAPLVFEPPTKTDDKPNQNSETEFVSIDKAAKLEAVKPAPRVVPVPLKKVEPKKIESVKKPEVK